MQMSLKEILMAVATASAVVHPSYGDAPPADPDYTQVGDFIGRPIGPSIEGKKPIPFTGSSYRPQDPEYPLSPQPRPARSPKVVAGQTTPADPDHATVGDFIGSDFGTHAPR